MKSGGKMDQDFPFGKSVMEWSCMDFLTMFTENNWSGVFPTGGPSGCFQVTWWDSKRFITPLGGPNPLSALEPACRHTRGSRPKLRQSKRQIFALKARKQTGDFDQGCFIFPNPC
jgi:hypothetical protein